MSDPITFTLTDSEVEATAARIVKFNALAAKHGVATTLTMVITDTRVHERRTSSGLTISVPLSDVTIVGATLKLAGGFELAATLDIGDTGNIFRTNPFFAGPTIPEEFRTTDATRCDHCGVKRDRKLVVLVHSATEGFKQVGSDCVRLFLGIRPESVFALATELAGFSEEGSYSGPKTVTVAEFVAVSSLVTTLYGFTPASFDGTTTRDIVSTFIGGIHSRYFKADYAELFAVTEEAKAKAVALATAAVAWVTEVESLGSEYILNLKIAVGRTEVGKNAGLLASLPNAFKRATEAQIAKAAKVTLPASDFIGTVGAKVTVTGKVAYTNRSDPYAYNGPEALFAIVVTDIGETVYINTTVATVIGGLLEDAGADHAEVTLVGTVKDHKLNNKGDKITVLTRAKGSLTSV